MPKECRFPPPRVGVRGVLRHNITGITGAALRRLARRGGISRVSPQVYHEAREALRFFLESILRDAFSTCEYVRRRTLTSSDLATVLVRRRCVRVLSPSGSGLPRGFFAKLKKPHGSEEIDEDDLTSPRPLEAVHYLGTISRLIREIIQDFIVASIGVSRAAEVLMRRASEDFVTSIFVAADLAIGSVCFDNISGRQQLEGFVSAARVKKEGVQRAACMNFPFARCVTTCENKLPDHGDTGYSETSDEDSSDDEDVQRTTKSDNVANKRQHT